MSLNKLFNEYSVLNENDYYCLSDSGCVHISLNIDLAQKLARDKN